MSCTSRVGVGCVAEDSDLAVLSRTMSILPLSEIRCLPQDQGVRTSGFLHTIASGPGSHLPPLERRARREAIRAMRLECDHSPNRASTLLLCEQASPLPLTARVNGRWSRAISRLLAPSLDRKLAQGHSPESHQLLAARAQVLVSPLERQALAHRWADLLAQTRRSPVPRNPRAPINRDSLVANEPAIRALLDLLVAQTPGQSRGIAMLSWLLSDGSGPLYNRPRSDELSGALLDATALLGSSAL